MRMITRSEKTFIIAKCIECGTLEVSNESMCNLRIEGRTYQHSIDTGHNTTIKRETCTTIEVEDS